MLKKTLVKFAVVVIPTVIVPAAIIAGTLVVAEFRYYRKLVNEDLAKHDANKK